MPVSIIDIEERLWQMADRLRANTPLRAHEYAEPVLGLIFLKFAYGTFKKADQEIKQTFVPSERRPEPEPDLCQLGDVLTLQRGFDITKKEQKQGSVPVISSSGINSFHNTAKVKGPGVIIGRKGSLGTVFYIEEDYWPHDTTLWVKDFHGNFPKFAYYFLSTLNLAHFDAGASNPTLNRNHIHLLPVYWPPLAIQRKIASILSAYDDLIENNTRRIAILEEMARMLYQEWFVHFRFPGHEKKTLVDSLFGLIPEEWDVVKLDDLCSIIMGQSPSSQFYNETGDGLPFHQGVTDFGSHFPTDGMYCTVANRIAEAGDILFSVRAPVGRINIANKKIVIGRGLAAIRSKTRNQDFVFRQLKELFQEEDIIGNGAIFQSVTKEDMQGIKMLRPPQAIVSLFEQYVKPILPNIAILNIKNANLRQTRDLLLPKLISSEIDVSRWVEDERETEEAIAVAAMGPAEVREREPVMPIDARAIHRPSLWE